MRVFTWASTDEYLPKALRGQARIMLTDGSWHPVVIHGETEAEAAQNARDWWATALEKIAKKHAPKKVKDQPPEPAPEPAIALDDPGDVV